MLKALAGRTVIVTGGSKGIGKGIARRFGAAGLNVLVVSRSLTEAQATAAEIGPNASGFAADVSDPEQCKAFAQAALDRYGRIDVLCANAGIFPAAKLDVMTVEDFDAVMNVNLKGTFLSVAAVLPAMKAAKWGRIVVTSSITGPITGYPGWAHYGASKAGQLGFVRTACIELAPWGITVNAVMPGNIKTEGLDGLGADYLAKMESSIPLKRLGSVEDIANGALFFASEEAGFITGQTLVIDGGQVLPESLMALEEMAVV
ncbi:3-oxoacyl-ACP reductase FabG [Xanthobacter agilis]|uniref:3-oxoacyl-[acyl-carrier protein] reductase n=1 Tax=Xanthobacter agilis TaxID=47492 RepID=A0ABU0L982_XANAG|nr:3-oxoacyl-ACP reductase FabG [Xanthobacter agilis]MDQ0503708.1 3-oxoacyl-[acyl-carrier protein] reductase [Xanthobacter agilis]